MTYRLGVDCGSVAVKAVLLDNTNKVTNSVYRRNSGIVYTLGQCLGDLIVNPGLIESVGVTGSGRTLAGVAIGADVVESEILAHAIAAIKEKPDVATILDIGGEDSKIIKVRDGIACDFRMNHICGAGTGAMIDSIALRLGKKIEDVGELAQQHVNDLDLPGKCGVFAQSAVVSFLNGGASAADILWGVCKAMVRNFILVGKGIELKSPFVFQGAVSKNISVVLALENELGCSVYVPEHGAYMGAIGAALLGREQLVGRTKFKGVNILHDLTTKVIAGDGCPNRCSITQLVHGGAVVGSFGARCTKCGG